MKQVGVFFGSRSPEHDVSIITGQLIISTLKKIGYQVTPVYITKQGAWMIGEDLGSIKTFSDPESKVEQNKKFYEYSIDLEDSVGKIVFRKKGIIGKAIEIDIAFPATHGSYGEDGTLQGLFEMLGVPYVGCDVPASAIAMDKALTKTVMEQAGVPTTKFLTFTKKEWEQDAEKIKDRVKNDFSWPVFVKPVHLGSSIGIGKVKNQDIKDLEFKVEVALHYDNKVLIEEGVENVMDVTCCLLGNETVKPSLLQESVFNSDLFDFETKYLQDGGAQLGAAQNSLVIPARLDATTTKAIQDTAVQVYTSLGCSGIARVDFLYDQQSKKFYSNEVNPLPGTLYHHLWKASGVSIEQVVEELIRLAGEKQEQKKHITSTFESNILKQLDSTKLQSNKLK